MGSGHEASQAGALENLLVGKILGRSTRRREMNYYLFQISYTSETWQTLIERRADHSETIRPAIKKMGGDLSTSWVCVGDYDEVAIISLPDEVTALAATMAFKAGGALREVKYTRLLTWEQAMDAMTTAAQLDYRPPA
jgi:uncharacterized protein with GYD domain